MIDRPSPASWTKYRYPVPRSPIDGKKISLVMWIAGSFLVCFGILAMGAVK